MRDLWPVPLPTSVSLVLGCDEQGSTSRRAVEAEALYCVSPGATMAHARAVAMRAGLEAVWNLLGAGGRGGPVLGGAPRAGPGAAGGEAGGRDADADAANDDTFGESATDAGSSDAGGTAGGGSSVSGRGEGGSSASLASRGGARRGARVGQRRGRGRRGGRRRQVLAQEVPPDISCAVCAPTTPCPSQKDDAAGPP